MCEKVEILVNEWFYGILGYLEATEYLQTQPIHDTLLKASVQHTSAIVYQSKKSVSGSINFTHTDRVACLNWVYMFE